MSKGKTGLEIIQNLIKALREVASVAGTVSDIHDPKLQTACSKLEKALDLAASPDRAKWLVEVNQRTNPGYCNWIENNIGYIAKIDEFMSLCRWTPQRIKESADEIADSLGTFEAKVRFEAEEAAKRILALLD